MNKITKEALSKFDSLVNSVMEAGSAAGLAAAVVDKNGRIAFERYYGFRDAENMLPIDKDTIFGLASISKSFTALAVMQLEEQGKLKLYDPISLYIPEFTNKNQGDPVLIWHLLCHSGGFYPQKRILMTDVANSLGLTQEKDGDFSYNSEIEAKGTELVAKRLDELTDLIAPPGKCMSYCNDGFGLLSHIVMSVSGEPSFADYVEKHILKPLGMTRSYCDFVAPQKDPNSEVIYKLDNRKRVITDNLDNAFVLNGGGAMKSTLSDMAKYVAMYINEGLGTSGRSTANVASIREMVKPRQADGFNTYYGFGLMINPMGNYTVIRHGGSLPGVSSHMAWSYEAEAGVVILCNTSGVSVAALADSLLRLWLGKDPSISLPEYAECVWDADYLSQICGEYRAEEGAHFSIEAGDDGKPQVTADGSTYPLIVLSRRYAVLRQKFADVSFEVLRDETRGVYAMRQGSRIVPKAAK
ncbi:MAG: serine hydrolase [Clostridiaceae bacterium]|nr:serine hydrolase [Clostridiaceae bacterium]